MAIDAVRATGLAIETLAREAHVRATTPTGEAVPAAVAAATAKRAVRCMLGLVIGDAIGTTVKFMRRDSFAPLTGMVGGGPFKLKPRQWTDDTAMALTLTNSLIAKDKVDERDLMDRSVRW